MFFGPFSCQLLCYLLLFVSYLDISLSLKYTISFYQFLTYSFQSKTDHVFSKN